MQVIIFEKAQRILIYLLSRCRYIQWNRNSLPRLYALDNGTHGRPCVSAYIHYKLSNKNERAFYPLPVRLRNNNRT